MATQGPAGHIFILTDPLTFSAAITTAAFVKDAGGDRVSIIGEPVGDRLSFFSEGGKACLPNLKDCVYYQTGKHDYGHACNNWHECFWLNWFYPVRVKSLQPDIVVPLTFEDWNTGRDAGYVLASDLAGKAQVRVRPEAAEGLREACWLSSILEWRVVHLEQ